MLKEVKEIIPNFDVLKFFDSIGLGSFKEKVIAEKLDNSEYFLSNLILIIG